MKEDTVKGTQVAANVAIIVAATLLSAVLIKSYIIAKPGSPDGPTQASNAIVGATRPAVDVQIQPGTKISLSGVDWAKNGRTLLLAVSDKCHFCSESAPFYQRLASRHGKIRLVAILPQPVDEGKKYLDGLNVSVDEIRQAPLTLLGIRGTPTLILVDNSGAVIQAWRGKLTTDKEAEVVASVQ
jgi:thiol-disulfide isomerase/thioredoxin